jgi:hypothetical protein
MREPVRQALHIANNYLRGKEGLPNTLLGLRDRGALGFLLAAEISIEHVTQDDPDRVPGRLVVAQRDLLMAAKLSNDKDPVPIDGLRASLRLAQLPTIASVFARQRLPSSDVAENMYSTLLEHSVSIREMHKLQDPDSGAAGALKGIAGEQAVLLLSQRHAIRTGMARVSIESFFSEDHGGNCFIDLGAPAWDMNTYTEVSPVTHELEMSMLQVKAKKNGHRVRTGVPAVYNYPDLSLSPKEAKWPPGVGDLIIKSCNIEFQGLAGAARATEQLDARTEKLLAITDPVSMTPDFTKIA